jgi:Protein of unknown function (DUF1579)
MPMVSRPRSRFAPLAARPSAAAAALPVLLLLVVLLLTAGSAPLCAMAPDKAPQPQQKAASTAPADAHAAAAATSATGTASAAGATAATGGTAAASPSAPTKEQMMEMMMKLAQPGEHHKRLDGFAGKWKTSGKAWMDPGQPPTDFTGTTESTWLLGGRYLQSVHRGAFFGMPFEGRGIDGYDNATNEYFTTWMDNMGTGVMVFRGKCDDPCKVLTETSENFDAMAGKVTKTKMVTTSIDPDAYRFEMYMVGGGPEGKDLKVMELTAKREK